MTTLMYFKLHLDFTTTVNNTLTLLRRRKPRDARRKPPLNAFGQMELEDRRAFAEDEGIGIGKVRLPLDEWLKEARGRERLGWLGWRSGWRFGKGSWVFGKSEKIRDLVRCYQFMSTYMSVFLLFLMFFLSSFRWLFTLIWQMMS